MKNDWNDDNKLSSLINNCLNIENDLNYVKLINSDNIKKNTFDIKFDTGEKDFNQLINLIKNFGDIYHYNFIKTKIVLNNLYDYQLGGNDNNIITKIGKAGYRGTLILNELEKNKEYTWKIKLLNSYDNFHFYVGVASSDFDMNNLYHCGWYLYLYSLTLDSGPPHNYSNKKIKANYPTKEIVLIMNMKERTLKFLIDNIDYDISYSNIPIDKPLYPAVFMYYTKDSIQFIKSKAI